MFSGGFGVVPLVYSYFRFILRCLLKTHVRILTIVIVELLFIHANVLLFVIYNR